MLPKEVSKVPEPKSGPGWVAWLAALIVSGCAAALSFAALAMLARVSGITQSVGRVELAWLLPVTVDAGVLVAVKFWLTPGLALRASAWAKRLSLTLIGVSCLGNIAGHGFAPEARAPFLVVAAVSLIAPLTLAGVAHLMVLTRMPGDPVPPPAQDTRVPSEEVAASPQREPVTRVIEAEKPAPEPEPTAVAAKPQPSAQHTRESADPLLDQLRAWIAEEGSVPSKRRVIDKFGIGYAKASKLMEGLEPHDNEVRV